MYIFQHKDLIGYRYTLLLKTTLNNPPLLFICPSTLGALCWKAAYKSTKYIYIRPSKQQKFHVAFEASFMMGDEFHSNLSITLRGIPQCVVSTGYQRLLFHSTLQYFKDAYEGNTILKLPQLNGMDTKCMRSCMVFERMTERECFSSIC